MTLTKKYAWSAVFVALAMVMATAMLVQTANAAAPTTVNVIIDDTAGVGADTFVVPTASNTLTVPVYVDVDDAGGMTDETIVTVTSTVGTFASSGTSSAQLQCAVDGLAINSQTVDAGDENVTLVVSNGTYSNTAEANGDDDETNNTVATEEGCGAVQAFLVIPGGTSVGTYQVTATTLNGIAAVESFTLQAAAGGTPTAVAHAAQSHDAIGYTGTGYSPWVNGTVWQVRVTDANGNGVIGRQVTFTSSNGVRLIDAASVDSGADAFAALSEAEVNDACDSTTNLGTSVIQTTGTVGTSSTNTGRAQVVACGTSDAAGLTATLTATVTGTSLTTTDTITVSEEPSSEDIELSITGDTLTVSVMTAEGIPAPDDTSVTFAAVPQDNAAFSALCAVLHDGEAETSFVTSGPVSALVTIVDDDDGDCGGTVGETWGSDTILLQAGPDAPGEPGGGGFTGDVADEGASLVVYNGGTVAQLMADAAAEGVLTVSVTVGGEWVVLVVGAPSFVNEEFEGAFPNGVPEGTPVVLFKR